MAARTLCLRGILNRLLFRALINSQPTNIAAYESFLLAQSCRPSLVHIFISLYMCRLHSSGKTTQLIHSRNLFQKQRLWKVRSNGWYYWQVKVQQPWRDARLSWPVFVLAVRCMSVCLFLSVLYSLWWVNETDLIWLDHGEIRTCRNVYRADTFSVAVGSF